MPTVRPSRWLPGGQRDDGIGQRQHLPVASGLIRKPMIDASFQASAHVREPQHEDEEAGLVHPYPAEHVRPPR